MSGQDVIVVGGGVIGITTAYELASRGCRTTLLEAREGLASETTYANGALLTPAMSDPWNAPGVHRHLFSSLLDPHAAMRLRPSAVPSHLGWGVKFLKNSRLASHRAATRASFLLCQYSVQRTRQLRNSLALDYHAASRGSLKIFRSERAMVGPLALAEELAPLGLRFQVIKRDAVVDAEPALQGIHRKIIAALRFPDDESGDAYEFSEGMAAAFRRAGGVVKTKVPVNGIALERGRVVGVVSDAGRVDAKTVIIAAGNATAGLVRNLGITLPIKPAKGYTVTFDGSELLHTRPAVPVIDDALHAAIVPLGTRLRVAGTVEFAGPDLRIRPGGIQNLLNLLAAVYPGIASELDPTRGLPWAGLRPISADGLPFVGPTPIQGLYINGGHGHLGWTLASGSAHLLADLVTGAIPQIDPTPYRTVR
jgi:D-amino-acid dehydrogenase